MPSFISMVMPLALAGSALANPLLRRGDDSCLAAVTGKAALGDDNLRKEHCSSFIKTIVTPSAATVTITKTDDAPATTDGWNSWKRDVTVCPNEVPNYASACDDNGYKSACSVWGVSGETTITIPATTSTKTVYIGKGGNGGNGGVCTSTVVVTSTKSACSGGTTTATTTETKTVGAGATVTSTTTKTVGAGATVTSTVTVGGSNSIVTVTDTVTSTVTSGGSSTPSGGSGTPSNGQCIDDAKALEFVNAFKDLLEFTSYNGSQGAPGRGYHQNISTKYLASDFKDYSDSINWMAGIPLNSVTFGSRDSFDTNQGIGQPELVVTTLGYNFGCDHITWRWSARTQSYANVHGINHMVLTADRSQIQTNYAEFNNANWIQSFSSQIPTISCAVPNGLTQSAKRAAIRSY
ncbi:hypothetical protein H2198_003262 [Neophaeococcomyces mojaviensis]|uniref:Uncharacterized protein n=1 Tax=Neophaeococcomyces mojaviensis TaxID=3383035 RepID=A0ACC3ACA2_9EURO|nr:hypothetical protein H2198_003262 [Knufia sp. JES_112]